MIRKSVLVATSMFVGFVWVSSALALPTAQSSTTQSAPASSPKKSTSKTPTPGSFENCPSPWRRQRQGLGQYFDEGLSKEGDEWYGKTKHGRYMTKATRRKQAIIWPSQMRRRPLRPRRQSPRVNSPDVSMCVCGPPDGRPFYWKQTGFHVILCGEISWRTRN